jgi:hypothetical protein
VRSASGVFGWQQSLLGDADELWQTCGKVTRVTGVEGNTDG